MNSPHPILSCCLVVLLSVPRAVVGAVGLASTPKISAGPLLRDSIFYGISVITLFVLYLDGCISMAEALMFPIFYVFYVTIVIVLQFKCCTRLLSRIECCCDGGTEEAAQTELTTSLISGDSPAAYGSLNAEAGSEPIVHTRKRKNTMSEFFNFDQEGSYMREIMQQKRYHFGIPRTAGLIRSSRQLQTQSMDPIALAQALGEQQTSAAAAADGDAKGDGSGLVTARKNKRAHSFSASQLSTHKRLLELTGVSRLFVSFFTTIQTEILCSQTYPPIHRDTPQNQILVASSIPARWDMASANPRTRRTWWTTRILRAWTPST